MKTLLVSGPVLGTLAVSAPGAHASGCEIQLFGGVRTVGVTFTEQTMRTEGRSLPAKRFADGRVEVVTAEGRERLRLHADGTVSGRDGDGPAGRTRGISGTHDCADRMQAVELTE